MARAHSSFEVVSLPKPEALAVERFIHRENVALFRMRLAEPHDDAERKVLLQLLAEEEAKDPPREEKP